MGPTELIVILVIVLVLFGGAMLPKLAKNIGQAGKELRAGLHDDEDDDGRGSTTDGDEPRR